MKKIFYYKNEREKYQIVAFLINHITYIEKEHNYPHFGSVTIASGVFLTCYVCVFSAVTSRWPVTCF